MKKSVLLISLFFLLKINSSAQEAIKTDEELPRAYFGIGAGINNFSALIGISAQFRTVDKLYVRGGVGLGGWGNKFSVGLNYGKVYGGWSYGIGYSTCPGVKNLEVSMELESGVTQKVTLDYLAASTLNISFMRNWKVGQKNAFTLEFGYAVPLVSEPWKVRDAVVISSTSKSALKILQPGGIILGVAFSFGT